MMVSSSWWVESRRDARTLVLLVVVLIGLPGFFFFGPGYHSSRSFKAAWDLGHVLFFFMFSLLVWEGLRKRLIGLSGMQLFLRLFILVMLLGILIETLQQQMGGRIASLSDVMRNQLGCLTAYVLVLAPADCTVALGRGAFDQGSVSVDWQENRWRVRAILVVAGCLLVAFWPLCRALLDERAASRAFPVLSDFEGPLERYRWVDPRQLRIVDTLARHGRHSLRVQLSTSTYSGTTLFYFPGDWRDYKTLRFSVYNPDTQVLELHCRIHDRNHKEHGQVFADRFHARFELTKGWHDLKIDLDEVRKTPESRLMDMGNVENLGFFVVRQSRPRVMYLDHIYLDR